MWEQIRSNQRRSALVVALLGALLVATGAALGGFFSASPSAAVVGGVVALLLWLVLWLVAAQGGDDILLSMAGAREIQKRDHPQLVNVVEEMTIAAALPGTPRIFIVDDPSPNAFAAGRRPEKATVAVTTGLLKILDRDELQGVVAHELGHIKNRDVALMTTAGIMLGAIVILADVGLRALRFGGMRRSRSSSKDGQAQAILLAVSLLFLILAPLVAQLVYFALSRRREYLADASGAAFTRYPEGLASALEKLGSSRTPLRDTNRMTAPMYIVRPLEAGATRRAGSLFATHPPLETRIRVLRSMGRGAGFGAYEGAYRSVTGKGVVGARTLAGATALPIRTALGEGVPERERLRQASDAYLAASGYVRRTCRTCGAVLKIPPALQSARVACPRCGAPPGGRTDEEAGARPDVHAAR